MIQAKTGSNGISIRVFMGDQHNAAPVLQAFLKGVDGFGIHAGKDTILYQSHIGFPTFTKTILQVKKFISFLCTALLLMSCKSVRVDENSGNLQAGKPFRVAFGSCNRTEMENRFWDDILVMKPDLWIWGGDNIYADTDDMEKMRQMYRAQLNVPAYRDLIAEVPVIGTWDDHDYGLNDGGADFTARAESQREFLNFMGVPVDSPRREREGIYTSHTYTRPKGKVRVIVLDTRYFRTPLKKDPNREKRYIPHKPGEGTLLGEAQWAWLERELGESDADFNILVSSIQVLSGEHGFETWGNFPHEVQRLIRLIGASGAQGVFILSGDRHISEFSRMETPTLPYTLVDFTSSGLTHAYQNFRGEPNPYRLGEVVARESFGAVLLDFNKREATFQMRGDGNEVLQEVTQKY
jgi:alkaline phosphatase D